MLEELSHPNTQFYALFFLSSALCAVLFYLQRTTNTSTSTSKSSSPRTQTHSINNSDTTTAGGENADVIDEVGDKIDLSISPSSNVSNNAASFKRFQYNYLIVYFLMMGADWMQGAYVYALYDHYGFSTADIGFLFVAGFGSSMVFGTIVGSLADKYGRKTACILYGVLYAISCLTKHFNDFNILLVGRILSGIATSILYSGFESWLVYSHNKRGYSPDLLSTTFSLAGFGNGLVAIVSGLFSNSIKDMFGFVGPFDGAFSLLVIGSLIIFFTWEENYGDENASNASTFKNAWNMMISDRRIILLGLIQSMFEGAMFTFVFMWTPALGQGAQSTTDLPHGWIFATFMVNAMCGSSIFKIVSDKAGSPVEGFMRVTFIVATLSLAIPIFFTNQMAIFLGFLIFEGTVGMFWPALGTMRSKYVPEESRATILNFFRIPLNAIVVLILYNIGKLNVTLVFSFCCFFLTLTAICQHILFRSSSSIAK